MRSKNLITLNDPTSHVTESYKMFRTNLNFMNVDDKNQVIMFTSATSSEGKTTTACNTAISFAENGYKTLLVECDLRRAAVHKIMDLPLQPGLTNIIAEKGGLDKVVCKIEELGNLDVLTGGVLPPAPAEMLDSKSFEELIKHARGIYDKIILDAPPILHVTDAGIISKLVDGVLLVAASHQTKVSSLQQAKKNLDRVNAKILGVVLTKVKIGKGSYYYDSYKSYYTQK